MTFVGKILVIVIMAFSLVFLGFSTVVFTTATNWKEATRSEKKKVNELQAKNRRRRRPRARPSQKELETAKDDAQGRRDADSSRTRSPTSTRDQAAARPRSPSSAGRSRPPSRTPRRPWTRPTARDSETELLRDQKLATVQKQANEFKLQQTELNDKIREPERGARRRRRTTTRTSATAWPASRRLVRKARASPTTSAPIKGLERPPDVEGEVAAGRRPEHAARDHRSARTTGWSPATSCSSTAPSPAPNTSARSGSSPSTPTRPSARVIGKTVNGKKIKEGDIVSSTIRPRS